MYTLYIAAGGWILPGIGKYTTRSNNARTETGIIGSVYLWRTRERLTVQSSQVQDREMEVKCVHGSGTMGV